MPLKKYLKEENCKIPSYIIQTEGNMKMDKKTLRAKITEKRRLLPVEYKKESSKAIYDTIVSTLFFKYSKSIFIYVSTPDEPDTKALMEKALSLGKTVYVPKCIKRGIMIPVKITSETEFTDGYMGIKEPAVYDENAKVTEIDLSVIPCVSASLSGDRLGHGAGFYDIFFKKVKTAKVCLCFHELISESIPCDENDVPMNAVITELGIFGPD